MKLLRILFITTAILSINQVFSANRYWVASSPGNWNDPSNWSTRSNGTPGASVPITGDYAYFNGNANGTCNIDVNVNINGINTTGFSGIIDLAGFTFNVAASGSGSSTFAGGTFNNSGGSSGISGTTSGQLMFSGATFNTDINVTAGKIKFSGGEFNNPVTVTDNGSSSTNGDGGCTFNSTLHVTNLGSSHFLMGHQYPDIFNGDVTLINNSTSRIRLAYGSSNNQFNGNIYINSSNGSGIYIGENGGTSTLSSGNTISISGGFSAGELRLYNFTQSGTESHNLTFTGTSRFWIGSGSSINGELNITAPRIIIQESTFNQSVTLNKNGANDDVSTGGNTFNEELTVTNSSSGSLYLGYGAGSIYNGNVNLTNSGSKHMYFARSGGHFQLNGDLTINHSSNGSSSYFVVCDVVTSDLTVTGNVVVNNNSSANSNTIELGDDGNLSIGGKLTVNNNGNGSSNYISVANDPSCQMTVAGEATFNNIGNGNTQRMYVGEYGSIQFEDDVIINNTSSANNSEVYVNHETGSNNIFNGNIEISSSNNSDGIRFGTDGGSATLAATKKISIGVGGFSNGYLSLYNFTQSGSTSQTLTTTGTSLCYVRNSNFGGNIQVTSPRINIQSNTFAGTSELHKTGASDDASYGANTFGGHCTLSNSGSGYFLMGHTNSDAFNGNLTINNTGSRHIYVAHRSAGNTVSGTLTVNNNCSSNNTTDVYIATDSAGSITIGGLVTLNNLGSSNSGNIYLGRTGDVTTNGNLTINNNTSGSSGTTYVGSNTNSSVSIGGTTTVSNNGTGTTSRVYLGNYGDVTFQNDLSITNSSSSTNSEIYVNHESNSSNTYNGNISISSTHTSSDGIRFGERGGSGIIAATKNVSIGTTFVSGELRLRNMTQLGTAAINLAATGTTYSRIQDSQFGGDFNLSSPRIYFIGTTIGGNATLEKTGAISDDNSNGGNIFNGTTTINNSGSNSFEFGASTKDLYNDDVTLNNTGSSNLTIAKSSASNEVNGNLTINNSAIGSGATYIKVADNSSSSLTVSGNTTVTNNGSSNETRTQLGVSGDVTISGNLSVTNSGTGGYSVFRIANGSSSKVTINGTTDIVNNNTASTRNRLFLGNSGDIDFNNNVTIAHHAGNSESEVFIHRETDSHVNFNGNITISSTNVNSDGFYFGNKGGSGTLANTKNLSILGNTSTNYVGGDLRLYNFTQVGTTPHSFELAATADYIYNSGCTWGGNISFIAPRIYNRSTVFNGTAYFEKTGKSNDDSYGENSFNDDVTYVHNNNVSSGRTYIAASRPNTYSGDLTLKNTAAYSEILIGNATGTINIAGDVYLYNSSTGTSSQHLYLGNKSTAIFNISGNLNVYNNSPATSNYHNIYIANNGIVNVTGDVSVENTGNGGVYKYVYLGNSGDININGGLNITNNTSATHGLVSVAYGSSSQVSVGANTTITNAGSGTTKRIYMGDNGDIIFNGTVTATNSSDATNSHIYFNNGSNSFNQFTDNIYVNSTHTSCDGIYFGSNGGSATLSNSKTITIPGGSANFVGGQLYFRNFTQTGSAPHSFSLASTATYIYSYNSSWEGNVNFSAPRIYLRGTNFSGTATIEKTGSGDDGWYGGNSFAANTVINNSGTGNISTGNNVADSFGADVTLNNSGTSHIYIAHNKPGNTIANNLYMNNSGAGTSIRVASRSTGSVTIGGNIVANNTSSANRSYLYIGESGDVICTGSLNLTNNASGAEGYAYVASNTSSAVTIGGNTTVNNSGNNTTKRVFLGNHGDVTFNGTLDVTNNSTATNSEVFLNYDNNSTNTYNQNITVSASGTTCDGIRFGQSGGKGILASGKTVTVGTGYSAGELRFTNFTQSGSTAQNLTLTGTALLNIISSEWNGDLTFASPRVLLSYSTFNGNAFIEKTGATNDASTGENIFNGETTLKNSGTAYFMPANGRGNDFNGNVTYIKTGTGLLYPTYNSESTYAGNITTNFNSTVRFGSSGSGKVKFDGTGAQSITNLGNTPEFRYLKTDKSSGELTLSGPIIITSRLDLTSGNIVTDEVNTIYVNDNARALNASNDAYVDGPITKIGNDGFTFPTGGNGAYAPIGMSSPRSGSDRFQANYYSASTYANGFDTNLVSSGLDYISNNEYWTLNRVTGSSNVKATLYWNSSRSGSVGSGSACNVRVARWNGTKWVNEGNGGTTGNAVDGSVITGTSEDCSNSTNVTEWNNNYPFTLSVDSNYITWDGSAYDGGSGTGSAPNASDAGRILKVYAPNAVLPHDANVAHVIVTDLGHLTIPDGKVLEVSGTINNNGEIVLENNSSLLQTIAGNNQNSGDGTYTVKRTGNNSAYSYNIWSSPIENTGLTTVFPDANPCDIWTFDENNQAWTRDFAVGFTTSCYGNNVTFGAADVMAGGDGIMDTGRGYFIPGATVSSKSFIGNVHNGNISVPVVTTNNGHQTNWNDDDWNLVGNPYPSGLDADAFLQENAVDNDHIDGSVYFWDAGDTTGGYNQHSDYATYNQLGGVNSGNTSIIPTGKIGSGQGFWVYALNNTNIEFNNSMRSGVNNQFFKTETTENHNVWISFTTPNNYTNNILVGYNENSTDQVDNGLDAHKLPGSASVRFASLIGQEEFAIQAIQELSIGDSKTIPLVTWSADSGIHTFSNYDLKNIPSDLIIYLHDKDNGTITNLKNNDYQVTLSANQTYDSRFELVFEKVIELAGGGQTSKDLGSPNNDSIDLATNLENEIAANQFKLATTTNGFILSNSNRFSGQIILMDVTGKVVWKSVKLQNQNAVRIETNKLSQGIYFVDLIEGNERIYSNKILKQ